jgi:hypothetical protein
MIKKIVAGIAIRIILLATPALAVHPLSEQQPASGSDVRLFEARTVVSASRDAVVTWNAIALRTAIQVARQNQPQSQMNLVQIQAAVYNAVVAIEGGYQPNKSNLTPQLRLP